MWWAYYLHQKENHTEPGRHLLSFQSLAFGFLACERILKVTHFPGVPQNLLLSAQMTWAMVLCSEIPFPSLLFYSTTQRTCSSEQGHSNYCKPVVTNCWSQTETYWSPLPWSLGISCLYHRVINHMLPWDICGFTWLFPWLFVPGWPIHLTYKGWGDSVFVCVFHALIQTQS